MVSTSYGWHWFRRDLRVADNRALNWSLAEHQGRVQSVFFFDRDFLRRDDFSPHRFQFFLETLLSLRQDLRQKGLSLLVLDGENALATMKSHFAYLRHHQQPIPTTVSWNRDYEPFARKRDSAVETFLRSQGCSTHTDSDHLLIEPHEIIHEQTQQGFRIFAPFFKRWCERLASGEGQKRLHSKGWLEAPLTHNELAESHTFTKKLTQPMPSRDLLSDYLDANRPKVSIPVPKAGFAAACLRLNHFRLHLSAYRQQREFPEHDGTSQLSLYLKNGSLTLSHIISKLGLLSEVTCFSKKLVPTPSAACYLRELAWREFYYHTLWWFPKSETESLQPGGESIAWENRQDWFNAWKQGQTGFPLVDAGMRQLQMTGWMHNRVRMVVASFLTKHLLIHWSWGARFFMEHLLDGDIASNSGGWQWAASTGCDAQPYFRIFNPWLQSAKFDPEGNYIRRFVPELRKRETRALHDPAANRQGTYPLPLVDHMERRKKALAVFSAALRKT